MLRTFCLKYGETRTHLGLTDILSQVLNTFFGLFHKFPHLLTLPFQQQLERIHIKLRQQALQNHNLKLDSVITGLTIHATLQAKQLWWHRLTVPLDFPSLPPTRPSRGSRTRRCRTRSTQTFCPACSNKPEAFYGAHTAAWLSPLRLPSCATL